MIKDQHNRIHDYLRISLIERCNLRCTYCMPEEGIPLRDKSNFMTHEELLEIVQVFVNLGVKKIRLTGGEPLIKKNFEKILNDLSNLPVELAITTNGILLDRYWQELKAANLNSLNISLDSLQEDRFNKISRRNYFQRILANIEKAIEFKFNVKLNVVLMKGINDDEIIDFINFTKNRNIEVRFIEFMPFDGNQWDWTKKVAYQDILHEVNEDFGEVQVQTLKTEANGTSRNFQINGFQGSFGIISSVTNPFCDSCNRIRLTADGKIKNCLFSAEETDLLSAFRNQEDLVPLITNSIHQKHKARAGLKPFDHKDFSTKNRAMTTIGG